MELDIGNGIGPGKRMEGRWLTKNRGGKSRKKSVPNNALPPEGSPKVGECPARPVHCNPWALWLLLWHNNSFNPHFPAQFMATNRTFTMIKPDAVQENHIGGILGMMEAGGFRVVELQKINLSAERAGQFYAVHAERPFYNDLVRYMSSGAIVAAVLEKDNAVADFRTLIGATNPANAEDGTIRKKYAKSIEANAVHGSDSDENAQIEADFFFGNK